MSRPLRRLAQSTIEWTDLKRRMTPSVDTQKQLGDPKQLFDSVHGAAKKQMERIAALDVEKPKIDWESYARIIKGNSDIVHDLKAKYEHLDVPYPEDFEGRYGQAHAKDLQIKEVRDQVLDQVAKSTKECDKDRTFFRRLPQARSVTEEMYMELFPRRAEVEPRDREKLEEEKEKAEVDLADYARKREKRNCANLRHKLNQLAEEDS